MQVCCRVPIKTRWVDTNKGDDRSPDVCCWLVAKEVKRRNNTEEKSTNFFASNLLLAAVKFMISICPLELRRQHEPDPPTRRDDRQLVESGEREGSDDSISHERLGRDVGDVHAVGRIAHTLLSQCGDEGSVSVARQT